MVYPLRVTVDLPDDLAREVEAYQRARPGLSLSAPGSAGQDHRPDPNALIPPTVRPREPVLDAGPLIALVHEAGPDHEVAAKGFRLLVQFRSRLFAPMPTLFEIFKWLLLEGGPQHARTGLVKVEEGAVIVPFGLEDLEEAKLLLEHLPDWGTTLEDASVALLAFRLKAPFGRSTTRICSLLLS